VKTAVEPSVCDTLVLAMRTVELIEACGGSVADVRQALEEDWLEFSMIQAAGMEAGAAGVHGFHRGKAWRLWPLLQWMRRRGCSGS